MYEKKSVVLDKDVVVPESALLQRERKDRYGSVPGLDDSELADPGELERQVLRQEFGPVLALPALGGKCSVSPSIDQDGGIDWGAFGTVDFERCSGGFDKIRYKADKVREQRKNLLILFGIVNERIKTRAKYLVLNYVRRGIIELEHITNHDMQALARLYQQAKRTQKEITELWEASQRRRHCKAEALWSSP